MWRKVQEKHKAQNKVFKSIQYLAKVGGAGRRKSGLSKSKKNESKTDINEPESRFVEALSGEQKSCLKKLAHKLTLPGRGIVDLSKDTPDVKLFQVKYPQLGKQDLRLHQRHLELYLAATRQMLWLYVNGLLLTETMLEFEGNSKLIKAFNGYDIHIGVRFDGAKWEKKLEGENFESVCLRLRLLGVEFVMWSVELLVTNIDQHPHVVEDQCLSLAKVAMTCQKNDLVPVLNLDLVQGSMLEMEEAQELLRHILATLVKAMSDLHVYKEGTIIALKCLTPKPRPKPVLGMSGHPIDLYKRRKDPRVTIFHMRAAATAMAVSQTVPPTVAGIALVNVDDSDMSEDTDVLNELNRCPIPTWLFHVSFCFHQVVQRGFLSAWAGKDQNLERACQLLVRRAKVCAESTMGQQANTSKNIFTTNITPY